VASATTLTIEDATNAGASFCVSALTNRILGTSTFGQGGGTSVPPLQMLGQAHILVANSTTFTMSCYVAGTTTTSVTGDHTHRQALQLRQNVAPEIHAIERSVIAPRDRGFALVRSRGGTAALSVAAHGWIVAGCSHGGDLCRPGGAETRDSAALRFLALVGQALIAEYALSDRQLGAALGRHCSQR
jgi:hypothetical protein